MIHIIFWTIIVLGILLVLYSIIGVVPLVFHLLRLSLRRTVKAIGLTGRGIEESTKDETDNENAEIRGEESSAVQDSEDEGEE